MSSAEKLTALRKVMAEAGVDAYFVPTADSHNSEYVAESQKRRQYISGFAGSAGTAVVTKTEALLWTDGRYWLQGGEQLAGTEWKLMKQGHPDCPTIANYIAKNEDLKTFGMDPWVTMWNAFGEFEKAMPQNGDTKLVMVKDNLVDKVWEMYNSPPRSLGFNNPVKAHPLEYCGQSVESKLDLLRQKMVTKKVHSMVLSAVDDIAWLLNLRGSDVDFNAVFLGYVLVTSEKATLYTFVDRVADCAKKQLETAKVGLSFYDAILPDLVECSALAPEGGYATQMDPIINMALYSAVPEAAKRVLIEANPTKLAKAIKNADELQKMKEGNLRDTVAVVRFLHFLRQAEADGSLFKETEYSLAARMKSLRAEMPHYVGNSFETISSFAGNCAVIHYRPGEEDSLTIGKGMYLVDSGGQYLDGATTDITRTTVFGPATEEMCMAYTNVLKGHIALARARFPAGTRGVQLDTLARNALWQCGLDYAHGTGHGVGSFLCVHEGPCGISFAQAGPHAETALQNGMILSNEPGFYPGAYGIRLENLVVVKDWPVPHPHLNKDKAFHCLENITFAPFEKRLVKKELLDAGEMAYLNEYHSQTLQHLAPRLTESRDTAVLEFLKEACAPLS